MQCIYVTLTVGTLEHTHGSIVRPSPRVGHQIRYQMPLFAFPKNISWSLPTHTRHYPSPTRGSWSQISYQHLSRQARSVRRSYRVASHAGHVSLSRPKMPVSQCYCSYTVQKILQAYAERGNQRPRKTKLAPKRHDHKLSTNVIFSNTYHTLTTSLSLSLSLSLYLCLTLTKRQSIKMCNTSSNLRLLPLVLLVLHALHDPPTRLLGILVRRLLVLHNLLHLAEVIRHVHALVDSGTLLDRLQPNLDFGETAGLDAGPFAPVDCKKISLSVTIDEERLMSIY
jgi:hypothetical protein